MRDHRKLKAFELADRLVLDVYVVTKTFPKDEMYGLTSQIRRAVISVASNIVEGCARHSRTEYVQFLRIAYASACEVDYQLGLATRLEYLEPRTSGDLLAASQEVVRVLRSLIQGLTETT